METNRIVAKMRRQKKYGANEKTEQYSRKKKLNKMEKNNLSNAQFKTLVIRMLKELIEYFNGIKKTQAEMKITLSENKNKNLKKRNIYREPTGEWMKPRIKSMI